MYKKKELKCGNPFKKGKKCGNTDIILLIRYKGKRIPICAKCWYGQLSKGECTW